MHFLLIRFYEHENFGIVPDILVEAGHSWRTLDGCDGPPGDIEGIDGVIVFGGVMNVWQEDEYPWLPGIKTFLGKLIEDRAIPMLGICLGHQLFAEAAGGACGKMPGDEIGMKAVHLSPAVADDPILHNFQTGASLLQWHGAEVSNLPPDAVVLASNETSDVQAMRIGSMVWGVQFHIEGTTTTVPLWGSTPAGVEGMQDNLGPDGYWKFRDAALANMQVQMQQARRLFGNFIDIARQNAEASTVRTAVRT